VNCGGAADETHRIHSRASDDAADFCACPRDGAKVMEEGDMVLLLMFVAYLAGCLAAVVVVEKWEAK
jgi:hypothetical protein